MNAFWSERLRNCRCLRSWALHLPMINVMRIKVVEKERGIGTGQRDVAGMVIKKGQ